MSMLTRELAIICEGRGLGTFITDTPSERTIFLGDMPSEIIDANGVLQPIPEGLYIIEVPSPPPHEYVDTEYPVIDFWYRSPHTDRAHSTMAELFELFHRNYNLTVDGWYIHWARALGNIVDVDRDNEGGKLLRLSVQFICRNLNHVS